MKSKCQTCLVLREVMFGTPGYWLPTPNLATQTDIPTCRIPPRPLVLIPEPLPPLQVAGPGSDELKLALLGRLLVFVKRSYIRPRWEAQPHLQNDRGRQSAVVDTDANLLEEGPY